MANVGVLIPLKSASDRRNAHPYRGVWYDQGAGVDAAFTWPNHQYIGGWSSAHPSPGGAAAPGDIPDKQFPAVSGTVNSPGVPAGGSPYTWDWWRTDYNTAFGLDWCIGYVNGKADYFDTGHVRLDPIATYLATKHSLLTWLVVDVAGSNLRNPNYPAGQPGGTDYFKTGTVVNEGTYANCQTYISAHY